MHRCKKTSRFFLKFLIILLLMSPHGHVNSQIKRESATVLLEERKLVSDLAFTTSSLSPEHFLKASHPVASKQITTFVYSSYFLSFQFAWRLQHHHTTILQAIRKSICNLWTSRTKEHSTPRSMKANTTTIKTKYPPVENRINQIITRLQFYLLNNVYKSPARVSTNYFH